jgi:hypothetical protein
VKCYVSMSVDHSNIQRIADRLKIVDKISHIKMSVC